MMRRKNGRLLIVVLLFVIGVNVSAAKKMVSTMEYFPLEMPHQYSATAGAVKYRTEFLGLIQIKERQFYGTATYTSHKGAAERLANRSVYNVDDLGNIYRVGYYLTDWYVKFFEEPDLLLKKEMELGKSYIDDRTVAGKRILSFLTLQKVMDFHLDNTVVPCIVVRKQTEIHYPAEGRRTSTIEYVGYEENYYGKGIGLIRHEGNCGSGCSCGTLAPSGKRISLTMDQ